MTIGVVGQKCGMTRIFTEEGSSVPVTVIKVEPLRVTQIKRTETDGYNAIQVTTGQKKTAKVTKPMAGHFAKANVAAGRGLWEFSVESGDELDSITLGSELGLDLLEEGQYIDVKGTSIGKGFAGGVKRHNFSMQDATHGNSLSHRAPGSIGQCQTPGRVFKGKKMAGHLGTTKATMQNLKVIKLDGERNLLLVKGSVTGPKGGDLIISPAEKKPRPSK